MRFKGKNAVVTAAASGMGRAGVDRSAREGAAMAFCSRHRFLDSWSPLRPVHYSSKFGVNRMMMSLAGRLVPENIRANAILFGWSRYTEAQCF